MAGATTEDFLAELAEQRRQSLHTISSYRRDLRRLQTLAGETPLSRIQSFDIRRFVAKLHGGGLSGRSLARTLSAWRGFYRWLGKQGLVRGNPCDGLRPPRSAKRLPRVLSVDEAHRLLDGSPAQTEQESDGDDGGDENHGGGPALAARDQAMFELFYTAGIRLAELAALNRNDGFGAVQEGEVRVTGKRAKTRLVPVGQKARDALTAWLALRDAVAAANESALFVSRRGRRLSLRMIQLRLKGHALCAGMAQHVHPHMLRHSCASHLLQESGDLRAVQELLGHASIASTQVYTHLDFRHLARVYDNAHPRARRKD